MTTKSTMAMHRMLLSYKRSETRAFWWRLADYNQGTPFNEHAPNDFRVLAVRNKISLLTADSNHDKTIKDHTPHDASL